MLTRENTVTRKCITGGEKIKSPSPLFSSPTVRDGSQVIKSRSDGLLSMTARGKKTDGFKISYVTM